ncbi:hypothetical protein ONZ45_g5780 [Pleurotus djamor]|nr:hypothetical protein ONZ45_g5780 [Pleurotus djamor]
MASKHLYALVTPLVYSCISITFSGAEDFPTWAAEHGWYKVPITDTWDNPAPYVNFPHISVPFHRLSKLLATFAGNPTLATYTESVILNPFSRKAHQVSGFPYLLKRGWDDIRGILSVFTAVHHISVPCVSAFPPQILRSLPNPLQVTHIRIRYSESNEQAFLLLKFFPNLKAFSVPDSESLLILDGRLGVCLIFRDWYALGAITHLSINDIYDNPASIPPLPILNNLISLQLTSKSASLITQLCHHLQKIEYLSVRVKMYDGPDVSDIPSLTNIPSTRLKYVHLESTAPSTIFHKLAHTTLFDHFTTLVILDVEQLLPAYAGPPVIMRSLRYRSTPYPRELNICIDLRIFAAFINHPTSSNGFQTLEEPVVV